MHGFNPWVRKSPRRGNGNSLQYPGLGNPIDRGAWWTTVHGVAKSRTWFSELTTTPIITLKSLSAKSDIWSLTDSSCGLLFSHLGHLLFLCMSHNYWKLDILDNVPLYADLLLWGLLLFAICLMSWLDYFVAYFSLRKQPLISLLRGFSLGHAYHWDGSDFISDLSVSFADLSVVCLHWYCAQLLASTNCWLIILLFWQCPGA